MAAFKNYYQILGVPPFSDPETVRAAFRKLARQHHPDLNAGNRLAEEQFKEINEAYEVLGNPEKRALYDASLKVVQPAAGGKTTPPPHKGPPKAQKSQEKNEKQEKATRSQKASSQAGDGKKDGDGKGGGTPINELFETFLKKGFTPPPSGDKEEGVFRKQASGGKTGAEKPKRGEDVVVKTAISPMEAEEGVVKTVNVQHNEICRRCSGTGKVSGTVCPACHGEKVLVRLKKIDVRIPAGVKNGSRVRVAREGGRGHGGAENGDLFLQIEIAYDPSLRIEGLDVHGDMPLSVTDAVLGGEIEVPTIAGPVKMTVPPGTPSGKVFRLKERGVVNGAMRGDHYVTVYIMPPENLTAREKELYQELARLRPEKPQPKKGRTSP